MIVPRTGLIGCEKANMNLHCSNSLFIILSKETLNPYLSRVITPSTAIIGANMMEYLEGISDISCSNSVVEKQVLWPAGKYTL